VSTGVCGRLCSVDHTSLTLWALTVLADISAGGLGRPGHSNDILVIHANAHQSQGDNSITKTKVILICSEK